ncbi:MAG: Hint domain-containing protein [Albidovulum sp.]
MPTFMEQFYAMDPFSPPPGGTTITQQYLQVSNVAGSGSINTLSSAGTTAANGDRIDGTDITAIYFDTIRVTMNGVTQNISGATFYLADGRRFFSPTDGTNLDPATFVSTVSTGSANVSVTTTALGPPCFTAGTLIAVPGGTVAVETLAPGDLVETLDHGPQVLRWIGQRRVPATSDLAPVRFAVGALGNDAVLLVSPQHRMLLRGALAELYFGQDEVLVAAKHLIGSPGVTCQEQTEVTYLHLLFDRHEIVFANGAPSESFHPGSILLARDDALRREIMAIFPDLPLAGAEGIIPLARPEVKGREARIFLAA